MDDVAAEERDDASQHDRRGHAVDVVVAVDGDPLAALDRSEQAVHSDRQVGHEERVVELIEVRIEKLNRSLRTRDATEDKQACDDAGGAPGVR